MSYKHILVIEDDPIFLKIISQALLKMENYNIISVSDGQGALDQLLKNTTLDAVILDLFLPDISGLEILKKIRKHPLHGDIPIIVLTSNNDKLDSIITLELGADDYITKPFYNRELIARLNAVMRRAKKSTLPPSNIISIHDIELNPKTREVKKNGTSILLTFAEYELLLFLMINAGNILSRDTLLTEIWGDIYITGTRTIDMHISSLRKKLGDENKQLIETIRGVGYRFRKK